MYVSTVMILFCVWILSFCYFWHKIDPVIVLAPDRYELHLPWLFLFNRCSNCRDRTFKNDTELTVLEWWIQDTKL